MTVFQTCVVALVFLLVGYWLGRPKTDVDETDIEPATEPTAEKLEPIAMDEKAEWQIEQEREGVRNEW